MHGDVNAMYKQFRIRWRRISAEQSPLRKMFELPNQSPTRMGRPDYFRTESAYSRDLLHAYLRRRSRAVGAVKATSSAVCEAMAQRQWQTASLLRLRRVWESIWSTPLPRHIFWRAGTIDHCYSKKGARALRDQYRSALRERLGERVDVYKGLRQLDSREKHCALRSRLCREKQLADVRYREQAGMGPPEQETIYRPTGSEALVRCAYHKIRRDTLCDYWYSSELTSVKRKDMVNSEKDQARGVR